LPSAEAAVGRAILVAAPVAAALIAALIALIALI
jgi:hypothetical protein